ncbi:MAG: cation transporter dimerization domain-containing protein, partial [Flavonifractor plautii]
KVNPILLLSTCSTSSSTTTRSPGRRLCSFHAEVPQDADILEAHDAIDHIEREIQQKFGIETTAHMKVPIATDDESVNRHCTGTGTAALARAVEPEMTIHDFRVTKSTAHQPPDF